MANVLRSPHIVEGVGDPEIPAETIPLYTRAGPRQGPS